MCIHIFCTARQEWISVGWRKWGGRLFASRSTMGCTSPRFLLKLIFLLIDSIWKIQMWRGNIFWCREFHIRGPSFLVMFFSNHAHVSQLGFWLSLLAGFSNQVPLKASNAGCTACGRRPAWQPVGQTLTGNDRRRWPLGDGSDRVAS